MADPHIKSSPTRDKEMKDKEDFATQNYNDKDSSLLLPDAETYKKRVDEKVEKELTNSNVNFIEDEVFEKELDYSFYNPQGESVIVLGPRVKIPSSSIKLSEDTKRDILREQLAKHESGYRVLAISPQVAGQMIDVANKFSEAGAEVDFDKMFYGIGTYVFMPKSTTITQMDFIKPLSPELGYYQVYHREIGGFITQETALKFKPKEKDENN